MPGLTYKETRDRIQDYKNDFRLMLEGLAIPVMTFEISDDELTQDDAEVQARMLTLDLSPREFTIRTRKLEVILDISHISPKAMLLARTRVDLLAQPAMAKLKYPEMLVRFLQNITLHDLLSKTALDWSLEVMGARLHLAILTKKGTK